MHPLLILGIGILTVLVLIIVARLNAFLAMIVAALCVSLLAPGDVGSKVQRVANAFGTSAGQIGIVIALASIIGKCMLDSGAADRIVRSFAQALGEKRAPLALMASGFVLAIPVFFDTVFYLLVPLARSLFRRTNRNYLQYLMAIGAGGAITHTLVPPTPGPLLIAANLGIDPGMMIMMGLVIAILPAIVGLGFAGFIDRAMPLPMRSTGMEEETKPLADHELPSLWVSLLPVILPVVLISASTLLTVAADAEPTTILRPADITSWDVLRSDLAAANAASDPSPGKRVLDLLPPAERELLLSPASPSQADQTAILNALNTKVLRSRKLYDEEAFFGRRLNAVAKNMIKSDISRMQIGDLQRVNRALLESAFPEAIKVHTWETSMRRWADASSLFGNANLALLISAIIAIVTLAQARKLSRIEVANAIEISLMSGGVIILITAAGGAFGSMLTAAQVGTAINDIFAGIGGEGIFLLLLGFLVAAVFKIAQGSTTVSMITTSGMLAGIASVETLGFHPVYLAAAIGCGGLVGSWMNDSGFWVVAKMGGLTEMEALKSWSIMLTLMAFTGLLVTVVLALVLPMR
jgi:H+/gluconate symporter-like permease